MAPIQGHLDEFGRRIKDGLADWYAVEGELGRGGMATVYLAQDLKHGRHVAIKVMLAQLAEGLGVDRFLREIQVAAKLQHPHIVPLHDSGEVEGFPYYVMPYVEGESLRERLTRDGKLPEDEALRIIKEVAGGLDYAHELGLVHRDIKPGNILLSRGHALITDFGIARAVSSAGDPSLTGTGASLGTPLYMSPEQAAGDSDVDHRADIYSLGCMLYELLSGGPPFIGPNAQAIVAKHLIETSPSVRTVCSTVSESVDAAIRRAMAKAPVERFRSGKDFVDAFSLEAKHVDPEIKSLAVLPFKNLSPDPDQEYFSDGLTEELISDLSKVRALRVISRTSAMLFKDSEKDLPTIARELDVRYVLEGSVRWAGNNLRITAQLIEAATDMHLWAEKYTGTLEDIFDLQEQLSRRIVEGLKVTLAPSEDRHLASREIPDVEAYALYLRARQEFQKMTEESYDVALGLLKRAADRVGPNALLLATAAQVHYLLHDNGIRPTPETLDQGDELADQALELDPGSGEAHAAKGMIAWRRNDNPATVRHLLKALDHDPGNARAAWLGGYVLAAVGRTDEGRKLGERARSLDPLFWAAPAGSLFADLFEGRFESALEKAKRMHAVSGGHPAAELGVGLCTFYGGRPEEAAPSFRPGSRGRPRPVLGVRILPGSSCAWG